MKETAATLRFYTALLASIGTAFVIRVASDPVSVGFVGLMLYVAVDFRRLLIRAPWVLQAACCLPAIPVVIAYFSRLPNTHSVPVMFLTTLLALIPLVVAVYLVVQVRRVSSAVRACG